MGAGFQKTRGGAFRDFKMKGEVANGSIQEKIGYGKPLG